MKMEGLMVPKERLMAALHREKPDRVPISVHQRQDNHLKFYLNGISALEAFQKFGMDAQIQYFGDVRQTALVDYDLSKFSTPPWRDEVAVVRCDSDNRMADLCQTGARPFKSGTVGCILLVFWEPRMGIPVELRVGIG
jgi:hypothetical protein